MRLAGTGVVACQGSGDIVSRVRLAHETSGDTGLWLPLKSLHYSLWFCRNGRVLVSSDSVDLIKQATSSLTVFQVPWWQ